MRNQIASIGINQSEETYLLAPKSLYKGEPLSIQNKLYLTHESRVEGVSESKDGPIKCGHDEYKAEADEVNNGTRRTKKRTLELRPKRTGGEQKIGDVKPEHFYLFMVHC